MSNRIPGRIDHPDLHVRHPLPTTLRVDGRPVWEPPPIDYRHLLDEEEYAKRRNALLKYYDGDVVKVTRFFDVDTEWILYYGYSDSLLYQYTEQREKGDQEQIRFLELLLKNLIVDYQETRDEWDELDMSFWHEDDGTYTAMRREEFSQRYHEIQNARRAAAAKDAEEALSAAANQPKSPKASDNQDEAPGLLPAQPHLSPLQGTSGDPHESDETTALLPHSRSILERGPSHDDGEENEDSDTSALAAWCSCPCI